MIGQGQFAAAATIAVNTSTPARPPDGGGSRKRRRPSASAVLLLVGIASTVAFGLFVLAGTPSGSARFFDLVVYHVPIVAGAAVCLLAAIRRASVRYVWAAFAAGLLCWTAADIYFVAELQDLRRIPYPSLADAGYLLALPFLFAGIGQAVRHRTGHFTLARWLDGAIVALAFACVAVALLAPALIGLTHGDPEVVLTNLAYPVGDLILLSFLVGALAAGGVRGATGLLVVAAGIAVWTGADAFYLYLAATDTYAGGWVDLLWPVGALLIAGGALAKSDRMGRREARRSSEIIPLFAALAAISILLVDHFDRMPTASVWLGGATLVAVAVRLLVSSSENRTLVRALRRDSVTDPLTGLGNRRRLFNDLEALLATRSGSEAGYLALFDLDGFKGYNDVFGHSLGDALLRNLGTKLTKAAEGVGGAYRLGGDEFCVLLDPEDGDLEPVLEALRTSLSERGGGFEISASCGLVHLGVEAPDANEALRIADARMYEDKGERSRMAGRSEAHDVLIRVLHEHQPDLEQHIEGVGVLARAVARKLELSAEEIDTVVRAAKLHDVGKVAIPDAILQKAGPLNAEEWTLMREHTLIGERILGEVPALRPVGTLVRSSHERWDGGGYPDGLAGEEIPLGGRIIFVCDAFDAMTEDRAYQSARSEREALAELRRHAGTQFDPKVVDTFCAIVESGEWSELADATPVEA